MDEAEKPSDYYTLEDYYRELEERENRGQKTIQELVIAD